MDEAAKRTGDGDGHPSQTENSAGSIAGEAKLRASQIRVLIVEDSSIIRERLAALISNLPNVVIVGLAEDGFKARALFRQHRPDAVVLDIQLPGINGMDLLAEFKQEQPACVVMVLTTYGFKEFRQRCADLGADYFFNKHNEFERVKEVLAKFEGSRGFKSENPDVPRRKDVP